MVCRRGQGGQCKERGEGVPFGARKTRGGPTGSHAAQGKGKGVPRGPMRGKEKAKGCRGIIAVLCNCTFYIDAYLM